MQLSCKVLNIISPLVIITVHTSNYSNWNICKPSFNYPCSPQTAAFPVSSLCFWSCYLCTVSCWCAILLPKRFSCVFCCICSSLLLHLSVCCYLSCVCCSQSLLFLVCCFISSVCCSCVVLIPLQFACDLVSPCFLCLLLYLYCLLLLSWHAGNVCFKSGTMTRTCKYFWHIF